MGQRKAMEEGVPVPVRECAAPTARGLAEFHAKVPEFLANEKVEAGGYMRTAKSAIRVFTRPNQDLPVRLAALVLLQSHGYESNVAVIQRKGPYGKPKRDFLRPHDAIRMLDRITVEAFKKSNVPLSDERREQLKPTRQHIRRAFAALEEAFGQVVRCRPNVPVDKIGKLSLRECLDKGFVLRLDQLAPAQLKRIQSNVCVFFLPEGRPARNLADVATQVATSNFQADETKRLIERQFVQMCFSWAHEYGLTDQQAEELVSRPEVQRQLAKIERQERALDRDKERLKQTFAAAAQPAAPTGPVAIQEPLFTPPAAAAPSSAPPNPTVEGLPSKASAGTQAGSRAPNGGGADYSSLVSQPRQKGDPVYRPGDYQLLDVLKPHVAADLEGCASIIRRCRESQPQCTVTAICQWAEALVKEARKKDTPFAWLVWKLPKQFAGEAQRPSTANPPLLQDPDVPEAPEPESPEVASLRELRNQIVLAENTLRHDPAHNQAKLNRLKADRDRVEAQLHELLHRKPAQSEEGAAGEAAAGSGD